MLDACNPSLPPGELKRWLRRFLLTAVIASLAIIALGKVAKQFPLRSPVRVICALLQGAASAVVIVGTARSIDRLDELQRRIHVDAMAMAFSGTSILATAYGFLVHAGLPDIDWGGILWPAMVGMWAVGVLVANRRYH